MAVRIKLRRDTPENWIAENPVLAEAEIGVEVNQSGAHRFKIGDGATLWTDLPYATIDVDDSRLSDPRAPLDHAASHELGGGDEIALAASQVSGLATVATSGDFADLTGTPPLPEFPVTSVNGKLGDVELTAGDVNAARAVYDNDISDPPSDPQQGESWFVNSRYYIWHENAWVEVGTEGLGAALALKADTDDVATLSSSLTAEEAARIAGDNALSATITGLDYATPEYVDTSVSDLGNNITAAFGPALAAKADQTALDAEEAARIAADTAIGGDISDLYQADTAIMLSADIRAGEVDAALEAKADQTALTAEEAARIAGDAASLDAVTDLGNNISAAFGPALDAKVDRVVSTSGQGAYTVDTSGNHFLTNVRSTSQASTLGLRTTGGQMRVGEAVLADAAVNKEQFDTALDAKANTADVDTALAGKADLATPWSPRSGFMYVIPEDIPNPLGLHGLSVGVTRWSWRDAAGPWEIESVGVQAGALGAAPSTWIFYVHLLGPDGPGELLGQSAPLLATVENGLHVISFASPVTVPAWATFGVGVQCISGGDTLLRQLGQYQDKFSSYANVATNNVYGWQANGTAPHGSFPTVGPNQGGSYSPKIYVGIA